MQNNFGINGNVSSCITREVRESNEYNDFVSMLAEWYTKTDMIIFYISLLNLFFTKSVIFIFNEDHLSVENNFNFSLTAFAKKNLLKLVSYLFKKTDLGLASGLDYQKLMLLILSSVTCGITVKDFFVGIRSCAFLVKLD